MHVPDERPERRLTAILAADVAGYSRLMGADEEGTFARLKDHRRCLVDPKVDEHRGRIVKTTGDGLLVEFASVVDAGRCAVEIQRGMHERNARLPQDTRIEFRIGIHTGDVISDERDIFGDDVNIAARLEGIAEPGGICVSARVVEDLRGKIDVAFEDAGEQLLKNIARPVRVYRVRSAAADPGPAVALPLPAKPSLAVLPFQNLSRDPEQDYFADGMVEDIITGLSRIRWIFVIARNSSFAYRGRSVDIRQVGRELGVRYVLEGSVRKAAGRVRITGQLIDAETGAHIWTDRYDGALEDVFELQDRITAAVVGAIEPSLRQAEVERARRKRSDSLDAYDLYLRALPYAHSNTRDVFRQALPLLERALAIDPNYAIAHGYLAWCREQLFSRGGFDDAERAAALRHARAAITHGADDSSALAIGAFVVAVLDRDFGVAFMGVDRALALNPNSALAYGFGALIHAFHGDPEIAIAHAQAAIRLSPFDPMRSQAQFALAASYLMRGEFGEAETATVTASPGPGPLYVLSVVAKVRAGKLDEARIAASRLLAVAPDFKVAEFCRMGSIMFVDQQFVAMIASALTAAGLP